MASSSNVLRPIQKFQHPTQIKNQEHIPDPNDVEARTIYASQLLLERDKSRKLLYRRVLELRGTPRRVRVILSPLSSKPPAPSKRKVPQTANSDDEDKSPPRTRQATKKRQRAATPSAKEKGYGSLKLTSSSDKVSSDGSPLKDASVSQHKSHVLSPVLKDTQPLGTIIPTASAKESHSNDESPPIHQDENIEENLQCSNSAVTPKRQIKEAPVQKGFGTSRNTKASESDSVTTGKKPTSSKPLAPSKRKVPQTADSDNEDKSPPHTRQPTKKRQRAATPSAKEKGSGSSKLTSSSDKVSSDGSPLKAAKSHSNDESPPIHQDENIEENPQCSNSSNAAGNPIGSEDTISEQDVVEETSKLPTPGSHENSNLGSIVTPVTT
ncbi:uncharacterized protein LOC131597636 [Vicia villosa]|uniref:uncharacterized protein LOC131597636 n=1 Tax=Vicia villosa TaxID=3911 RepID=UPI00273B9CBB|nr:uncharacterized protein LOC131597636 [Vicia villosa]